MAHDPARTRRTFYYELGRSASAGVIETAGTTFLLLIAVQEFQASTIPKVFVAASGSLGLLISPLVVALVTILRWRTSRFASLILALGAFSFALAALWPNLGTFVACSVLAMTSASAIIPLLTQMYQENYPEAVRGRLFSRTVMVRIAAGALFAKAAGDALTGRLEDFPWLLVAFALALALASFCLFQCPSQPIQSDADAHPLRMLRYVWRDRLFRQVLLAWMLLGFANLMMFPLRVEYLAHPRYQLQFTPAQVALLTSVIPNVARLLVSPLWGHLFDRMNFVLLRSVLNVGFAVSILLFFSSHSWFGLACASVVYGISNAGGEVAWSLWVTKIAPPSRVADYMSIHTFLTGFRGVIAPLCGFYFATLLPSLAWLAAGASAIILLASVVLIPEIRQPHRR